MPEGFLQIGEVAERAELSLRTVRYYEEQGLLTPARRSDGGFRLYTDEQVRRLLVIKQMKPLDFSVEQMRELLTARDALADPATPAPARTAARATIAAFAADVATRVAKLRTRLANAESFAAALDAESSTG
jgi:MerR family transcriptional regulator, copper efflux regulator